MTKLKLIFFSWLFMGVFLVSHSQRLILLILDILCNSKGTFQEIAFFHRYYRINFKTIEIETGFFQVLPKYLNFSLFSSLTNFYCLKIYFSQYIVFFLSSCMIILFFKSFILFCGTVQPLGVTWVNFGWVCTAGLSEPQPHYSLFCGQL